MEMTDETVQTFCVHPATRYLKVYTDFSYFLACFPFRIVRDKNLKFTAKTWVPQKTICFLLTLLSVLWFLREIRLSIPTDTRNPSELFGLAANMFSAAIKVVTIKTMWWNQSDLVKILNFISRNLHPVSSNQTGFTKYLAVVISSAYVTLALPPLMIRGTASFAESFNLKRHFQLWTQEMMKAAEYNFFLPEGYVNMSSVSSRIFFITITSVGMYQRYILGLYSSLLVLMLALTLKCAVKQFQLDMPFDGENSCSFESRRLYQNRFGNLQRLAAMLNSTFGINVFCFLLESIVFYSINFGQMFHGVRGIVDGTRAVRELIYFFGNTCAVFIISAQAAFQVLQKSIKYLDPDKHKSASGI